MVSERWKKGTLWQYKLSLVKDRAVQQKPQIEAKVPVKEKPEEGPAKVVEEENKLSEAQTDADVRKLAFF